MDRNNLYCRNKRAGVAVLLNELYEVVYSMTPRSALDESAISHFRSLLEHRISLLYLSIFTESRSKSYRETQQSLAIGMSTYPRTTSLLPQEYQNYAHGIPDVMVLEWQYNFTYVDVKSSSSPIFQQLPVPLTSEFAKLSKYIPARFLSAFGVDEDMLFREQPGINDVLFDIFQPAEDLLRKEPFCSVVDSEHFLALFLRLFPHALAISTRAVLDSLVTTTTTTAPRRSVSYYTASIIVASITVINDFIKSDSPDTMTKEEPIRMADYLSTTMYSWAEKRNMLQRLEKYFTAVSEII